MAQIMNKKDWVDEHWDEFLSDLEELVCINSERDDATASKKAPWGEGPFKALQKTLDIADRLGFETTNLQNAIGYADFQGASDKQIGMIGHVDVVPAGSGWSFDPYSLSKKDGYLIGRGVIDDKGPLLACIYAAKYCSEQANWPYTLETGFGDLGVYFDQCGNPDFTFTPDANWPLIYGEKGVFKGDFVSEPITDGNILEWRGGVATNVVPDEAHARIKVSEGFSIENLTYSAEIEASLCDNNVLLLKATGKTAHASKPETGESAILKLANYVLDNNLQSASEMPFVKLVADLSEGFDGKVVGIDCCGKKFDALTIVAGVADQRGDRLTQSVNIRFPENITGAEINDILSNRAEVANSTLEVETNVEPHLTDPEDPKIKALYDAYREVTGDDVHKPQTIGSGSYARYFKGAVSFGILKNWENEEPWVGKMHAPNEAVRENDLKEALLIYITALQNLIKIGEL